MKIHQGPRDTKVIVKNKMAPLYDSRWKTTACLSAQA